MGEFRLSQFTFVAIYFIALLGLNILTGYNGQISLGHGAFMGIGAYVGAMLTLGTARARRRCLLEPPDWLPLGDGMRPVFTIPLAGPDHGDHRLPVRDCRRSGYAGVSLALATFALAVSLPQVAKKFDTVTGGGGGLVLNLPTSPFGWDISVRHWLYYEAWVAAGDPLLRRLAARARSDRARVARDPRRRDRRDGVRSQPRALQDARVRRLVVLRGRRGRAARDRGLVRQPRHVPAHRSRSCCSPASSSAGSARCRASSSARSCIEFLPIYAQDPPLLPVRALEAVADRGLRGDPDPDHVLAARRRREPDPARDCADRAEPQPSEAPEAGAAVASRVG